MRLSVRFRKCKKGAGTIVSTVMFFLIAIAFVGGTFVWQVKSQTEIGALDDLRMDEQFSVEPTFSYDKDTETFTIIVKVRNSGPIDVKLVQAWIIDETNNDHQHIDIYYYLGVDESTYILEIDELIARLTHTFNLYESTYYIKIVSERGNIASSGLIYGAEMNIDSDSPVIIDRETSWVKKVGNKGQIKLHVFNQLDEAVIISLVVATKMDHGAEHSS